MHEKSVPLFLQSLRGRSQCGSGAIRLRYVCCAKPSLHLQVGNTTAATVAGQFVRSVPCTPFQVSSAGCKGTSLMQYATRHRQSVRHSPAHRPHVLLVLSSETVACHLKLSFQINDVNPVRLRVTVQHCAFAIAASTTTFRQTAYRLLASQLLLLLARAEQLFSITF